MDTYPDEEDERPSRSSFLDRWYRLRRFERSGRLYAALGLVGLFRRVAALFGEELPEPGSARFQREHLERVCARARYHELINVISVLIQLPLPVMAWHVGHRPLVIYAFLLLTPHIVSIMLERYKRAVCHDLLAIAGDARSASESYAAPVRDPASCSRSGWFFGPFPCETEKFYTRIGVESFRRFVIWLISISTQGRGATLRNVVGGRAGLAAFDAETRTAEKTHLFGLTLHLPFAIVFARTAYLPGLLFVVFLWSLNLVCALLQRWHRVRLQSLLRRRSRLRQDGDRT